MWKDLPVYQEQLGIPEYQMIAEGIEGHLSTTWFQASQPAGNHPNNVSRIRHSVVSPPTQQP